MREDVVRLDNTRFLAHIPEGWDERTQIKVIPRPDQRESDVIIVNPDHAPMRFNNQTNKFEEIKHANTV